jgi:hypothetical protein
MTHWTPLPPGQIERLTREEILATAGVVEHGDPTDAGWELVKRFRRAVGMLLGDALRETWEIRPRNSYGSIKIFICEADARDYLLSHMDAGGQFHAVRFEHWDKFEADADADLRVLEHVRDSRDERLGIHFNGALRELWDERPHRTAFNFVFLGVNYWQYRPGDYARALLLSELT